MKNTATRSLALAVLIGVLSLAMLSPIAPMEVAQTNASVLSPRLTRMIDKWPLNLDESTSNMASVLASIDEPPSISSFVHPNWEYRDCFNFTNSEYTFGPEVMTEEEVEENLRNYIFQLLYGDIEAACRVSILDIMLFRVFDSLIVDWIGIDFMGFCNGMSMASRDYFMDSSKIPLGKHYAYDLPSPDPNSTIAEQTQGDVTESAIKEYVLWKGSAAFFNPNHLLNWVKLYLGLSLQSGGTNNALEFQKLTQLMMKGSPQYQPVVILMTAAVWENSDPGKSHFVVAYDYETNSNGTKTIYIYDNRIHFNSSCFWHEDWILLGSDGTFSGTHLSPEKADVWRRMCVYPASCEYNSILTTLAALLPNALQFLAFCPVDLIITDPLGRKVGPGPDGQLRAEFPAIYVEDGDQDIVFMPYAPGLPYTLNVTGTGQGNYTLEINRVVDGQIVTQSLNGQTEEGKSDVFSVAAAGGSLNFARQGVVLSVPTITSASSVNLQWSRYDGLDFNRYEVLQSTSLGELGQVVATVGNQDTTSCSVSNLQPGATYFFTVRVDSSDYGALGSNQVGAAMPESAFPWTWVAVGTVGAAAVIVVLALSCKSRK